MKKLISVFVLGLMFFSFGATVFAQGTVLPGTDKEIGGNIEGNRTGCTELLYDVGVGTIKFTSANASDVLGCAIKTGDISLWMIPHFLMYAIEGILAIAGLIAVLFIIIGGYQYAIGGLTEEKDKGKKTIMYAIGGLVVALLAWGIVSLVQLALTG